MSAITLNDFLTHLKKYIFNIANGEKITIYNEKQLSPKHKAQHKKRPFGLCKGKFIVPADFNDELPEKIVSSFYA